MALVVELVFLDWGCPPDSGGEDVVVAPEIDAVEGEITVLKGILLTAVIGIAFNPLIWIGIAPGGIVFPAKMRRGFAVLLPDTAAPLFPFPVLLGK